VSDLQAKGVEFTPRDRRGAVGTAHRLPVARWGRSRNVRAAPSARDRLVSSRTAPFGTGVTPPRSQRSARWRTAGADSRCVVELPAHDRPGEPQGHGRVTKVAWAAGEGRVKDVLPHGCRSAHLVRPSSSPLWHRADARPCLGHK
jgi:hypothetical protein